MLYWRIPGPLCCVVVGAPPDEARPDHPRCSISCEPFLYLISGTLQPALWRSCPKLSVVPGVGLDSACTLRRCWFSSLGPTSRARRTRKAVQCALRAAWAVLREFCSWRHSRLRRCQEDRRTATGPAEGGYVANTKFCVREVPAIQLKGRPAPSPKRQCELAASSLLPFTKWTSCYEVPFCCVTCTWRRDSAPLHP